MTNPLFGDTVTAYINSGDSWARYVLTGVQWHTRTERTNDNGRNTLRNVTSVTIPAGVADGDKLTADGHTVLVLGTGPAITAAYTITQLRADCPTYCTVRSITDDRLRPRLKHWRVIAE